MLMKKHERWWIIATKENPREFIDVDCYLTEEVTDAMRFHDPRSAEAYRECNLDEPDLFFVLPLDISYECNAEVIV